MIMRIPHITRQDSNFIADALASVRADYLTDPESAAAERVINSVAYKFAHRLRAANPAFDHARFIKATDHGNGS
jgi:hypothetical protein